MRSRSNTKIGLASANSLVREIVLLPEGREGFARRLDVVEHAVAADEGQSTLLR
jgi:hypothetical protein